MPNVFVPASKFKLVILKLIEKKSRLASQNRFSLKLKKDLELLNQNLLHMKFKLSKPKELLSRAISMLTNFKWI